MNCRLNYTRQQQDQDQWCWAAVAASVSEFYDPGTVRPQCDIVNAQLRQTTCCAAGSSDACNQPSTLEDALQYVGHFSNSMSAMINFADCDSEVCTNGRPFCVRIQWANGNGHFVAVTAVGGAADQVLLVQDPFYGENFVPYNQLATSYQDEGQWTDTYLTQ